MPLSLVARLEEIEAAQIEWAGGRPLIQYRGRLMPLVPVGAAAAIKAEGPQAARRVLRRRARNGAAGRRDRRHRRGKVSRSSGWPTVPISSARRSMRGRATEIVDVAHYLPLAHEDWARPADVGVRRHGRSCSSTTRRSFGRCWHPVLKAAGYRVATAESADQALALGVVRRPHRHRRRRSRYARARRAGSDRGAAGPIPALPACR